MCAFSLLFVKLYTLDQDTGGVWKGTINANGDVTFANVTGTSIGAATSIVQFSSPTLAYAAMTGLNQQRVKKCTVVNGDLDVCSNAASNPPPNSNTEDVPAFGGLVIVNPNVYLCK
jgi:hypothetical protein